MKRDKYNMIKSLIDDNENLYDFCIECIEHIFKEDAQQVKWGFESTYQSIEEGYGLSLEGLINNEEIRKKNLAAYKEKNKIALIP